MIPFINQFREENPLKILQLDCHRPLSPGLAKFSSLKGRVICVLKFAKHSLGIVLKPALYLVIMSIVVPLFMLFLPRKFLSLVRVGSIHLICAPIGQTILTIKAFAGIFHPGAYYRTFTREERREQRLNEYVRNRELRTKVRGELMAALRLPQDVRSQTFRDNYEHLQIIQEADLRARDELIRINQNAMNNLIIPAADHREEFIGNNYNAVINNYADFHDIANIERIDMPRNAVNRMQNAIPHLNEIFAHPNREVNHNAAPVDREFRQYFTNLTQLARNAGCNLILIQRFENGERIIRETLGYLFGQEKESMKIIYKRALKIMCEKLPIQTPDRQKFFLEKLSPSRPGSGEPPSGIDACPQGLARLFEDIRVNIDAPIEPEKMLSWIASQYKLELINQLCARSGARSEDAKKKFAGLNSILRKIAAHETNQANGLIVLFGQTLGLPDEMIKAAHDCHAQINNLSEEEINKLSEALFDYSEKERTEFICAKINGTMDGDVEGLKEFRLHIINTLIEEYYQPEHAEEIEELKIIHKEMLKEYYKKDLPKEIEKSKSAYEWVLQNYFKEDPAKKEDRAKKIEETQKAYENILKRAANPNSAEEYAERWSDDPSMFVRLKFFLTPENSASNDLNLEGIKAFANLLPTKDNPF